MDKIYWNIDLIKQYLKENTETILLSTEYKSKTPLLFKCKCGNEFYRDFIKMKSNKIYTCTECNGRKKWDTIKMKKYISQFNLTCDDEYKTMHTKMNFKCSCGNVFKTELNKIIYENKITCLECSHQKLRKERSFTYDEVKNYVENTGCDLISEEYINANTIMIFKCKECGQSFETTFHMFKDDNVHRCKNCTFKSKGEYEIRYFLKSNNINFNEEKIYIDCKYKNVLPFDFYLPNYNILIEYDGEQHYNAIDRWGGKERLHQQQVRDKIKTDYCLKNKIKLIRIPYWEFDNIENILTKEVLKDE